MPLPVGKAATRKGANIKMAERDDGQDSLIEAIYSSLAVRSSLSTATVDVVNFSKAFIIVRLHDGPIGICLN